jgi:hypothetical protein
MVFLPYQITPVHSCRGFLIEGAYLWLSVSGETRRSPIFRVNRFVEQNRNSLSTGTSDSGLSEYLFFKEWGAGFSRKLRIQAARGRFRDIVFHRFLCYFLIRQT